MNKPASCELPRLLMLSLALVQGLALFGLYKAISLKIWPYQQPLWLFPLYTLVITVPLIAQLALYKESISRTLRWLLPFSVLVAATAAYTGWQAEPAEFIRTYSLAFAFCLTIGITCFKAVMYIQQRSYGEPISYAALFKYSWRNFLVVGLSLIFVLIFWGILVLWAALFKAIGLGFFEWLFSKDWFLFPVLTLAGGMAIIIFRNLTSVIDVIARVLQAMSRYLLPLLIGVSITFLAMLPFTGLNTLWNTRSGSLLLLWLQALTLFFVNTVYQDGSQAPPYSVALHRFIYLGIAVLPIYSVIIIYGLYLRIAQYGWTIERCWGILIWLLLALFAAGYLWGILRHRDNWIRTLGRVNIVMGLVVMLSMLLVNSPLLDFRKISLDSQMARLNRGEIELVDVDVHYIARNLGRPGYLALQKLKASSSATAEFIAEIDTQYRPGKQINEPPDLLNFTASLEVWPRDTHIPESLLPVLHAWSIENFQEWRAPQDYALVKSDLNGDGLEEYVLIETLAGFGQAQLWRQTGDAWERTSMSKIGNRNSNDLKAFIEKDQITIATPQWKQLEIGDVIFRVDEDFKADEAASLEPEE